MAGHMDGQMSVDPKPKTEEVHGSKVMDEQGATVAGGAQGGGLHGNTQTSTDVDAMEIDSRGNAHGQTQEQIERQQDRVRNTIEQTYQKMRGMQ